MRTSPVRFVPLVPCSLVLAVLGALAVSPAAAQTSERGAYIVRLGNDTLSIERFTRTRDRLEGDRVLRAPRTSVVHYVATLGRKGYITQFESSSRPGNRLDQPATQSSSIVFGPDSATVTSKAGDSTRTYSTAVRPGAVPQLNLVYALYEQAIRQALAAKRDSVAFDQVYPGALTPVQTYVKRVSRDSVAIGFFGDPVYAGLDHRRAVTGFNGMHTTQKFIVTRLPDADVEAAAREFAAREAEAGPAGQLSPRDTARITVAGANLVVDYGRPRKRGRVIFGDIVPWGEVWRTGANAATGFTTDRDLTINGTAVPAGSYTLWTVPSKTEPVLIVNRQTGQWGTDYDATQDLVRIPLKLAATTAPVEQFTISLTPSGDAAATLSLGWDDASWAADVLVK